MSFSKSRSDIAIRPLREVSTNTVSAERTGKSSAGYSWWPFQSNKSTASQQTQPSLNHSEKAKLSVVLCCSISGVSIQDMIAQVYGGPLNSARMIRNCPDSALLVEFMNEESANICRQYIKSRKCVIYGSVVTMGPLNDDLLTLNPSRMILAEQPKYIRRTLVVFKRLIATYDGPELFRCDIDPPQLMRLFGQVGKVIQIRPMIHRKHIAFAVDFEDIMSAVLAKQLADEDRNNQRINADHPSRFPGLQKYDVRYTYDVTERPFCFC